MYEDIGDPGEYLSYRAALQGRFGVLVQGEIDGSREPIKEQQGG